jgi:hypothetical protein
MAAVPTYDPITGQWVQQDQGYVPVTGDSGVSYSSSVYDILNRGVGVLLDTTASGAISVSQGALSGLVSGAQDRFESAGGITFQQGQPAQGAQAQGASGQIGGLNVKTMMILGAVAILGYLLFIHKGLTR